MDIENKLLKKRFKNILTENQSLKKLSSTSSLNFSFDLIALCQASCVFVLCLCLTLSSIVGHLSVIKCLQEHGKHKLTNAFTTTSFIFNQFIKDKPFCASFNFSKLVITCEI